MNASVKLKATESKRRHVVFKLMKDESCFKKEFRADLIEMHFKDNKASFLKVIKSIIETELDDFIKIEIIENKLKDYKTEMQNSIGLFC